VLSDIVNVEALTSPIFATATTAPVVVESTTVASVVPVSIVVDEVDLVGLDYVHLKTADKHAIVNHIEKNDIVVAQVLSACLSVCVFPGLSLFLLII